MFFSDTRTEPPVLSTWAGPKNAKLFMFKDLHFIRLRTHAKHFIQDTVLYKQAKLFSQDTVQPNCLYQCSFREPVQKYRYLVRGSGPKIQNYGRSRIL